ncbi:hypothetical protein BKA70DRAFT_1404320 [Coprinopsis sp. MPI-PUGE-AT-0042]|nr:hypothetical protein BKA70DRAFT_1404320 [Coprinopsis sp. MPI-PUGE-AT-0042]
MAAKRGHTAVVRMLLNVPNVDITIRSTTDGHTAMSAAQANGHRDIVQLLQDFESRNSVITSPPAINQLSLLDRDGSDSDGEEVYYDAEEGSEGDGLGTLRHRQRSSSGRHIVRASTTMRQVGLSPPALHREILEVEDGWSGIEVGNPQPLYSGTPTAPPLLPGVAPLSMKMIDGFIGGGRPGVDIECAGGGGGFVACHAVLVLVLAIQPFPTHTAFHSDLPAIIESGQTDPSFDFALRSVRIAQGAMQRDREGKWSGNGNFCTGLGVGHYGSVKHSGDMDESRAVHGISGWNMFKTSMPMDTDRDEGKGDGWKGSFVPIEPYTGQLGRDSIAVFGRRRE